MGTVFKSENEGNLVMPKHKEQYLGYNLYLDYAVEKLDGKWRVSYRVTEEFKPMFSDDHGCEGSSYFKEIGYAMTKEEAIKLANEHYNKITVCDLRKDFVLGDDNE